MTNPITSGILSCEESAFSDVVYGTLSFSKLNFFLYSNNFSSCFTCSVFLYVFLLISYGPLVLFFFLSICRYPLFLCLLLFLFGWPIILFSPFLSGLPLVLPILGTLSFSPSFCSASVPSFH